MVRTEGLEEFSPSELMVAWYTQFQAMTKQQVTRGMKKLFEKIPSYQADISSMFPDKDELYNIGPYMLVETFHRLRQNEAIIFDEENNTYTLNKRKYSKYFTPITELFIIIPEDMNNYIESYFEMLTDGELLKNQLFDGIQALRLLWKVHRQGKKYVSISTETPFPKEGVSMFKIKFNPAKFVSETKDYDNAYKILKTDDINVLIPEKKMTLEKVKSLGIPGLEAVLYTSE